MGKYLYMILVLVLFLAFVHANARSIPVDHHDHSGLTHQLLKQPPLVNNYYATAPAAAVVAESPTSTGLKDKKNFLYRGVGGFAGMGGYAGVVGGLPVIDGLGGIGNYGGMGGGGGGIGGGKAGGAPGGGIWPCP